MVNTLFDNALLWLLPIALPLAAAVALLLPRCRRLAEHVALWSPVPALLLALAPQATRSVDIPWLLLGSRLGLDTTSRAFLFFTSLLWLSAGVFASGYLAKDARRHLFLFFFQLSMGGNLGLILAQDMAFFYVCFALMSFASYGLVVFNRDEEAFHAGRVYIALVIVGELLLFSGLVVAASSTGSLLWAGLGDRLAETPVRHAAMLLLFWGLAVKAGALPLHVWLPLAHPAAPVPASAVLSGAMINAGLLGWLRLVPSHAEAALPGWAELCLALGAVAAFYGAVVGLTQQNAKTLLAYSSISQMGLMTIAVGLALGSPGAPQEVLTPAVAYAMHHGLAKGALFLGVGVASSTCGAVWHRAWCALGLLLPALAVAGMPLTSGAVAKSMLKISSASAPAIWPDLLALLLPAASIGTTLLMARFLWLTWPKRHLKPKTPPGRVWLAWLLLLAATAGAVFLWPWSGDTSTAESLLLPAKPLAALWPVAVGTAVAAIVAVASVWGFRLSVPVVPAGDILALAVSTARVLARACAPRAGFPALQRWRTLLEYGGSTVKRRLATLSLDLEATIGRGPVFGIILLSLVGLLLGLIAFPRG